MFFAWPFVNVEAVPLTCGVPFGCEIAMLAVISLVPSSIYVVAKPSDSVRAKSIPVAWGIFSNDISVVGLYRSK